MEQRAHDSSEEEIGRMIESTVRSSECPEAARLSLQELKELNGITLTVRFGRPKTLLRKILNFFIGEDVLTTRDGSEVIVAVTEKDGQIVVR